MELVFTARDVPKEFLAVMANVYLTPFFKLRNIAGLLLTVRESPVCRFLIWYSSISATRALIGGSN